MKTKLLTLSPKKREVVELVLSGLPKEKILSQIAKSRKVSISQKNSIRAISAHITMAIQWIKLNKPVAPKVSVQKTEPIKMNEGVKLKDWSEGKDKESVRKVLAMQVSKSPSVNNDKPVLTLSADKCLTEIKINKINEHLKFVPIELDRLIFDALCRNIKNEKWNFMKEPINCGIGQIIDLSTVPNMYAHLFLDFCKSLVVFRSVIESAISKNLVCVGGIIWITVECRVGGSKNKGFNTENELKTLIKKCGGRNYHTEFKLGYNDSGSPMYSVIIRRLS